MAAPMELGVQTETIPKDLHGFLNPHDSVAISFWIVSIAMVASTVFFLAEAQTVLPNWRTSIHVGSLVTLVAAVHYFYMREYWITIGMSPIVYRYIDWSITVPLQMIEFYLILSAVKPSIDVMMFYRLLVGTVVMLLFGYLGEIQAINAWVGFAVGLCGWGFILFEIFAGEAGNTAGNEKEISAPVQSAFATMRFIVSIGWSIYPLGYFFGYLTGAVSESPLNCIYNVADFVNKIWFCLAVWGCAKADTAARGGLLK
jgi:bacteriorhodopsin